MKTRAWIERGVIIVAAVATILEEAGPEIAKPCSPPADAKVSIKSIAAFPLSQRGDTGPRPSFGAPDQPVTGAAA